GHAISMTLITGLALGTCLILGLVIWLFSRSRKARVETGHEGLIGLQCVASEDFDHKGRVQLRGESWLATSESPVVAGQTLVVVSTRGLTVHVRPADTSPE